MPNYRYHLALTEGKLVRRIYRAFLPTIVRRKIQPVRSIPLQVFAYSGAATFPEQVASIRSFLRHAGRPTRFTVVSDGTLSARSWDLLQQIDSSVTVTDLPEVRPDLRTPLRSYLATHATGKQLSLIMSLPREGPALYVDSDVLFYPGAADLELLVTRDGPPAYYLADCQSSLDQRLLRSPDEATSPVNTGVLLIRNPIDWSLPLQRFCEMAGPPNFFSNQTLVHLAMHANGAFPFDQATCVLQVDDQTSRSDHYARQGLILRHYVGPVRHKFWIGVLSR